MVGALTTIEPPLPSCVVDVLILALGSTVRVLDAFKVTVPPAFEPTASVSELAATVT